MKAKISALGAKVVAASVVLVVVSFGIQPSASIPGYAVVFLDDSSKTFIALPCIGEWQHRSGAGFVRRGTANEAWELHYGLDRECKEAGGYIDDEWPLPLFLLSKMGLFPATRHWWDRPYRTEDSVVQPGRPPHQ